MFSDGYGGSSLKLKVLSPKGHDYLTSQILKVERMKDMNFFDLCVVIGQAIGRGCKAVWSLLLGMIRRTYRYWWVVVPVLVIGLAAALYISRPENLCYKMNAVAHLNGPTIQQFEQAYAPMRTGLLPDDAAIAPFVWTRTVKRFDTYRVVDCLDD